MFQIAAFSTYVLITAITPGPNNILSMSNASRLGFRKSFPFNLGILVGFVIVMTVCTFFSSMLFTLVSEGKLIMQIVGAAYLLYLAYKTFTTTQLKEANARDGFVSGMLLQFINPKAYLYGFTSMGTYILPHFSSPAVLFAFAFLLAFAGFVCTILWALFGSLFRSLLHRHGKIIYSVMALLLVYCAVSLFL